MPPMETRLTLMKRESECHTFIRSRVMLQANLELLERHSPFRRSSFLDAKTPTANLRRKMGSDSSRPGLDKDYAQGITKHQPRHVEAAMTCSCTECVALRDAIDAVAPTPPTYNTGPDSVWENGPDLVDRFGSTTLERAGKQTTRIRSHVELAS
jgi:hypothetical protein